MQQQFISQPVTYQTNSALGVQSLMPQAQSVVPQIGAQTLNLQSVAVPQVQSVDPSVVPQMQSVVPSVIQIGRASCRERVFRAV